MEDLVFSFTCRMSRNRPSGR